MRIDRARLNGRHKVAIDAPVLRRIIQAAIAAMPFSAEFYRTAYPDIAAAADAGQIVDLHQHFVQTGYFEGRAGHPVAVDDAYYTGSHPDVAEAIARGDVAGAGAHYLGTGAAEGRVPHPALTAEVTEWVNLLRVPVMAEA